MNNDPISKGLQNFIARYINSVEQIEILCLLADNPSRAWTEREVLRTIQSSQESVAQNLRYFANEKILIADGTRLFRFAPDSPELTESILSLIKAYREKRVTVVKTIYTIPLDKTRISADQRQRSLGK